MRGNPHSLVSIIIPCYKQGEFLAEALESVIAQTYQNWECLVINDGSPDNTKKICLKFCALDSRIQYFSQDNAGVCEARNLGLSQANGEFILPLDADDTIQPTYIEKALARFTMFPETDIVYCDAEYFGVKSGIWDLANYSFGRILCDNCIFCSAVIRRKCFSGTTKYDKSMALGFEDWDLYLQILLPNSVVFKISEPLFQYRIKTDSRTTALNVTDEIKTRRNIYQKHAQKTALYFSSMNSDFLFLIIDRYVRCNLFFDLARLLLLKVFTSNPTSIFDIRIYKFTISAIFKYHIL